MGVKGVGEEREMGVVKEMGDEMTWGEKSWGGKGDGERKDMWREMRWGEKGYGGKVDREGAVNGEGKEIGKRSNKQYLLTHKNCTLIAAEVI